MSTNMTKDQIRHELQARLHEYFDGYILVGHVAGRPEVIIIADPVNAAIRHQLSCGALNLINSAVFNETEADPAADE